MITNWFSVHNNLATAGRLPAITRMRERISAWEIIVLIFCGFISAAASGLIRPGLGIPGHSIILSMLPMALGLALVPRRFGGFIMGAGAFGTAAMLGILGLAHLGSGAFVSLCLIGPIMDIALLWSPTGWLLYASLILAGITTNLLAFLSRRTSKLAGLDLAGTRPFVGWWEQAIVTYSLCGAVAGLIAALCFFHLRRQRNQSEISDRGTHS